MKDVSDVIVENEAEFKRIFGARLRDYYDAYPLGFDILKFDDKFLKSEGRSMRDCLIEKYGVEAYDFLLRLVRME